MYMYCIANGKQSISVSLESVRAKSAASSSSSSSSNIIGFLLYLMPKFQTKLLTYVMVRVILLKFNFEL